VEEIMEETIKEVKFQTPQDPRSSGSQVSRWLLQALREVAETVIPAVVIALVINLFLAQATQVLGQSMEPNLHSTQRVVVEKVTYRLVHGPRRGDIVVIDLPEQTDMLIKRVMGLPGETIEVRDGKVYIEGEQLDESWTVKPGGANYGPQTIPPLHVFVMGDNRGASNDSRNFGPVAIEHIVGHAWFSYWPLEYVGFVE
jgi:signal peptidase I